MHGRVFVPESRRASILVEVGRMEERAAKSQIAHERERSPVSEGHRNSSAPEEASERERWTAGDDAGRTRTALSASQEQEDILEAWRKKRRQEMAVRDQAMMGEGVHKPAGEGGSSVNQEGSTSTQGPSEGDDEELLNRLRKRLGISEDPVISEPPLSNSPPVPNACPQDRSTTSSPPQNAEASSSELRPIARSFSQSPRGEFSQPLRFSSNTPPVSPRRSLSPASRGGKRSSSEPATSRMNPAFVSVHSTSDASSPSSSAGSEGNTPSKTFEFSPPSTPTSQGAIFEAPARRSSLLTAEDEALLAAMSLVGRSRSRSSPATKRLPRGNSGLPPQHVPPSQLRRAVSIDPRVEARAVEQRAAEKSQGEIKRESLKRASLEKEGTERMREDLPRKGSEGSSMERDEKRTKRLSGEWTGHSSEGEEHPAESLASDAMMQATASPENQEGSDLETETGEAREKDTVDAETADAMHEQYGGSPGLHSIPEAFAGKEGSGRGKGLNKGLVLQILGFGDEDELEGFGRFLSPVKTKVSDKNSLRKKRSNSFSEFTTIPSPPKMPTRLRGTFDKGLEEWSPGRARKGFGFAGSRGRKQAPMQPAVANLIAETVEDFWSSDLMGAWGMGQSETEVASPGIEEEMRPESAPVQRRILSEDPVLDSDSPQQQGFRGPSLLAVDTSLKEGNAQPSDQGSGLRSGDHAQQFAKDEDVKCGTSGKIESVVVGPGDSSKSGIRQPPLGAGSDMQEDSLENRGGQNATVLSDTGTSGPRKEQAGMSVDSPQPEAGVFDGPKVGHPRVGPPLMDDVFEDGPDVIRLREAIEQREADIRNLRSG